MIVLGYQQEIQSEISRQRGLLVEMNWRKNWIRFHAECRHRSDYFLSSTSNVFSELNILAWKQQTIQNTFFELFSLMRASSRPIEQ